MANLLKMAMVQAILGLLAALGLAVLEPLIADLVASRCGSSTSLSAHPGSRESIRVSLPTFCPQSRFLAQKHCLDAANGYARVKMGSAKISVLALLCRSICGYNSILAGG